MNTKQSKIFFRSVKVLFLTSHLHRVSTQDYLVLKNPAVQLQLK